MRRARPGQPCLACGQLPGTAIHSAALPGMETTDTDRETVRQLAQAEELTAAMRTPKADISAKAGRIERESPLFFGTGGNPTLF
jgi:hypothetical protein